MEKGKNVNKGGGKDGKGRDWSALLAKKQKQIDETDPDLRVAKFREVMKKTAEAARD